MNTCFEYTRPEYWSFGAGFLVLSQLVSGLPPCNCLMSMQSVRAVESPDNFHFFFAGSVSAEAEEQVKPTRPYHVPGWHYA